MTIPDQEYGYCAVIQISGFKTEKEANDYIYKYYQALPGDILEERTTLH